jgi:hypothetical protein
MRFAVSSLTLLAVLGLAACANNPNRPTDTGSMQQPAATGGVTQAEPRRPDTGSMQQPAPYGGVQQQTGPRRPDTGSMQYPGRSY